MTGKRFSKEELATGPRMKRKRFEVYMWVQIVGDESVLIKEIVESQFVEIEVFSGERVLFFYDLVDMGKEEVEIRAYFNKWASMRAIE